MKRCPDCPKGRVEELSGMAVISLIRVVKIDSADGG